MPGHEHPSPIGPELPPTNGGAEQSNRLPALIDDLHLTEAPDAGPDLSLLPPPPALAVLRDPTDIEPGPDPFDLPPPPANFDRSSSIKAEKVGGYLRRRRAAKNLGKLISDHNKWIKGIEKDITKAEAKGHEPTKSFPVDEQTGAIPKRITKHDADLAVSMLQQDLKDQARQARNANGGRVRLVKKVIPGVKTRVNPDHVEAANTKHAELVGDTSLFGRADRPHPSRGTIDERFSHFVGEAVTLPTKRNEIVARREAYRREQDLAALDPAERARVEREEAAEAIRQQEHLASLDEWVTVGDLDIDYATRRRIENIQTTEDLPNELRGLDRQEIIVIMNLRERMTHVLDNPYAIDGRRLDANQVRVEQRRVVRDLLDGRYYSDAWDIDPEQLTPELLETIYHIVDPAATPDSLFGSLFPEPIIQDDVDYLRQYAHPRTGQIDVETVARLMQRQATEQAQQAAPNDEEDDLEESRP